jgi:hypothetical protein
MQSLSNVIVSLQGIVSEPVRCLIARRFAATIACEVQDGDPYVPDDLDVEATELARFCDRWMSVQAFREPGVEEWTPITPDMNALRSTMVAELQALAEGVTVTELNDV